MIRDTISVMGTMLSIIVLVKDEEKNIVDCIESVLFADEIVVIDDYSSDRTLELIEHIKNSKIKIYKEELNNDFSQQRNFGLSKAKNEWVLFIDADERVTKDLQDEILLAISSQNLLKQKLRGFYIKRRDFIWGKELKHGEVRNIKLLRLAKKNAGIWRGMVHEQWEVEGKLGELESSILHFPHQSISVFLKEINFYTDIRALELYNDKKKVCWWSIIVYPAGKFIHNYILRLGLLDGVPGLVFTVLMSFHSFMVRGKLWLLWQKNRSYTSYLLGDYYLISIYCLSSL